MLQYYLTQPERRLSFRLRYRVDILKKENRDLFISVCTHVHGAVNMGRRCIPIDLAGTDFYELGASTITKFNTQSRASQHNRYSLADIAMPVCCVIRLEDETAH